MVVHKPSSLNPSTPVLPGTGRKRNEGVTVLHVVRVEVPQLHSRHPIQLSLLHGPGREGDEGEAVLVHHVVWVENTPTPL